MAVGVLRFPSALKGSQAVGVACQFHTDSLATNPKGDSDEQGHGCKRLLPIRGVGVHSGAHSADSGSLPDVPFCSNMSQHGLVFSLCPGVSEAE